MTEAMPQVMKVISAICSHCCLVAFSFTLLSRALLISGLILVGEAFFPVLRVSRSLDEGRFRPRTWYPVVVTCIACLPGLFVALALWMTG